jgi:hypothetical protein
MTSVAFLLMGDENSSTTAASPLIIDVKVLNGLALDYDLALYSSARADYLSLISSLSTRSGSP